MSKLKPAFDGLLSYDYRTDNITAGSRRIELGLPISMNFLDGKGWVRVSFDIDREKIYIPCVKTARPSL